MKKKKRMGRKLKTVENMKMPISLKVRDWIILTQAAFEYQMTLDETGTDLVEDIGRALDRFYNAKNREMEKPKYRLRGKT